MKEEKVKEIIGAANQAAQQPQGLKITPDMIRASKNVACECGGMLFTEKIFFKRISPLISQSGKEEMIPMPVFVCEKCGKVPQVFDSQNVLPDEIKTIPVPTTKQAPFTVQK